MNNVRVYGDLPTMILRIIVEKVTKCDFWYLIHKYILDPCETKNTFIYIPQDRLQDCISNNYEMRIINNELKVFDTISLGKCNDSKASDRSLYGNLFKKYLTMNLAEFIS